MSEMTLIDQFRTMVTMRHFEEACLEGVSTGEIHGELHTGIGQEAISAGMIGTLRAEDAVVSTHRNHLHGIAKGVPLKAFLAEIYERETGLCKGRGGHMHPFDPARNFSATGIVGSSIPVALGYAYAFWFEGEPNVAVAVTGDGGTNTGAFHECMNIAGAWKLPLVVVVENNIYAISVRIEDVSATPTLAERASAYSAWGQKVDGTDVEQIATAFAQAVEHARGGKGPALLEATCYRFRGHYEGDHDSYRSRNEREQAQQQSDPLLITRQRLIEAKAATEQQLDEIIDVSKKEMSGLLAEVRADPMPDPMEVSKYCFVG
ncbi:MAG: thiamine pyrophosphate-dependent dehydrogenase E1 component subunit alpha [Gammaproteobacteria bacterium]|nr:thiamine pyrophosphate-dependent dehydrogenase E1 component subunit alpha [Gammaproteobacteria bacterium]